MSATDSAVHRLRALGHSLPAVGSDSQYVNHRTAGSSIYVSGQLPYRDGQLLGQGTVGDDVDVTGPPANSPVEVQMVCTRA